jgi:ribosome maturation factor RimP
MPTLSYYFAGIFSSNKGGPELAKNKLADIVEGLVAPVVEEMAMELVDVEYVKEGSQWYLRVFIDKTGGIFVDDCQAVSQKVSRLMDEKDPIPHAYILEVSSPGLDRPLKKSADYERFCGYEVVVTTYAPFNGKKSFSGRLDGLSEQGVIINVDGTEYVIPVDQVASARLAVDI